jgi:hypothetical protein
MFWTIIPSHSFTCAPGGAPWGRLTPALLLVDIDMPTDLPAGLLYRSLLLVTVCNGAAAAAEPAAAADLNTSAAEAVAAAPSPVHRPGP